MSIKFQPPAPLTSEQLIAGGSDLAFVNPGGVSRCKWSLNGSNVGCPHEFESRKSPPAILPDVLHKIGNTPLIKLNNIPKSFGIQCEMLAKCEFFNPGGSVKDRIGLRMVEDAERRGLLKPGNTIIEPTSGNTGIGLAMAAAVKGYRCIIILPQKMSDEKVNTLKALGAEIVRTPTSAAYDSPEGLIAVAQRMCREIPNSIILDQYRNAYNPIAHYENTAEEIYEQCDGRIDMVVCGAGTGGTISGIGRRLKELCPTCKVVAADPEGSILALPESLNKTNVTFYEVEGIGYDFIPTVLDRSIVDEWMKCDDKSALPMARRLIKEEGLLCGGSSGSAMCVAVKAAKQLQSGQRCVVLLPDGMRNYMTKFINDSWMQARQLYDTSSLQTFWWSRIPVSALTTTDIITVESTDNCLSVTKLFKEKKTDHVYVRESGTIIGYVTNIKLAHQASQRSLNDVNLKQFVEPVRRITNDSLLQFLSVLFDKERFVLIEFSGVEKPREVTPSDLLNFIAQDPSPSVNGSAS